MLQLGSILHPIWLHFGKVLGAKMGPSWLQMPSKIDSKSNSKNYHLLNGLKTDFGPQLGGQLGLGGGANSVPIPFPFGDLVGSWPILGPSSLQTPQDGLQTPPRWPQSYIFDDFRSISD